MVKFKSKKLITVAVLFIIAITCVLAFFNQAGNATVKADNLKLEQELSDKYYLGDQFTPPSAKIVYAGNEYSANVSSVTFPDGRSYKSNSYVLSVPGKYMVNYNASVGNNFVVSSVSFSVYDNAYSVSSSNSSAYYTNIDNTDASGIVLTDDNGEKITTSGIKVSLTAGDMFTYKKPINLYGKTKLDNILTLYSLPEIIGKADARILRVRLTDVYDSSNYVDVVTYGNYGDEDEKNGWALYSGAGANGQPLTGIHFYASSNERTFTYQGQLYTHNKNISYNSANGYPSFEYSLAGKKGYGAGAYTLSMNYDEKQIFGCKTIAPSSNGMIVDLDEPLFFDNLWEGFTTGEVYLSVSADNYVGSSFSFIITNILGENLQENTFNDKTAPNLNVDLPKEIPSAIIGKEYKLFDAKAMDDIDGETEVDIVVKKNYYSSNSVMINVVNGAFIPHEECSYTIIYKAVDRAGNVQTVLVDVLAKEKSDLSIEFNVDQTSGKAGEVMTIAKPQVVGNDGKYELTVSVVCNNEKIQVLPNENGEYLYRFMNAGAYSIEYVCADYNSAIIDGYGITIDNNQTPLFTEEVNLPPVFVKGVDYKLPAHKGYDFSTGNPVVLSAKTYYSFDGGEYVEYSQGANLKISANESVKIKYSIGKDSQTNKEYLIPVADVGLGESKYIRSKYFYGDGFTTEATADAVSYTSNLNNAQLTFVNKLLMTDFSLKYQIKETKFERVIFTFKDSQDNSKKLTVSLREKDFESYYLSINGKAETIVNKAININNTLMYKDDEKVLTISGLSYNLSDFEGFPSKLAWLDVSFVENTFANFIVTEINAQKLNAEDKDNAAPLYSIKVNNDEKSLGEELVVSRFIAGDVLKFNAKCYLTIYAPDNKPCETIAGVTMKDVTDFSTEHVIKLNKLGTYRIVGQVTDGVRKVSVNRQVNVKDSVAPVITLTDVKETAYTGSIRIAKYKVEDNDSSVFVSISVQCPDMSVISITNDTFVARTKGVYTVMFFATDEAGNVGFASYEVVVK